MDYQKDIESTLDALILNAAQLQDAAYDQIADAELSDQQKRLLDSLFNQWNTLTEEEKNGLLAEQIESKVQLLAKKNQACLREVKEIRPRYARKSCCLSAKQLDMMF